jgi:uncharacterized membrane protein
MAEKDLGKCSTGMQPNLAALLSYVAVIITGIIFYLIEKENKFVRFHAMQSILFSIAMIVITGLLAITIVGVFLIPIVSLAGFIVWIMLMLKAFQGEMFKLPLVGDIAEKQA